MYKKEKNIERKSKVNMVNILWTGGWDSTFRIVELSKENVKIQPYYVLDNTRKSQKNEIETMENIVKKLKQDARTKAEFLPINFVRINDIERNEEITNVYKKMHKIYHIGSQYNYLVRLALKVNNLELGLENAETSKALNFIKSCGAIKETEIDGIKNYEIDPEESSYELKLLFSNFNFPIIDKTKLDMKKITDENNYEDIMNMTWFCHNPIDNKPCGYCNPCVSTIKEGMKYRFSEEALKRYNKRKYYRFVWKIKSRVSKISKKLQ